MPPIRDAMRFVDHQQANACGNRHQDVFDKFVVGQPFWRNQQSVHLALAHVLLEGRPVFSIGRIDGLCANSQSTGGFDLVPHQGEQWRNNEGRATPRFPQNPRGDEVDRALSPSGALHHKQTATSVDQRIYGFPLPLPEVSSLVVQGNPEKVACHRPIRQSHSSS